MFENVISPLIIIKNLFFDWWWILPPFFLFPVLKTLWLDLRQGIYGSKINWILLEITIPKDVFKTPKATEQMLTGFHGIQHGANLVEKYWKGSFQEWLSLEIVGVGGEIHFFIYGPDIFKDLIEAQVYAQYPEAEIHQVEDYTRTLPADIPNKDYDLWGTELALVKPDVYPIRTYMAFEEQVEERRIDPLASLTEVLSTLKEGEQIWLQYLIKPAGPEWKKKGEEIIAKMTGRPSKLKPDPIMAFLSWITFGLDKIIFGTELEAKKEQAKEIPLIYALTPGQREVLEAMEKNIAKIGFQTKIRFVYLARKSVFDRTNVSAIMGVFKQFNTLNLNSFYPDKITKTKIDYLLKNTRETFRKREIFRRYRERDFSETRWIFFDEKNRFVFNTEELATVYHYPGIVAAAPLMPRIEAKKGEPPKGLPVE